MSYINLPHIKYSLFRKHLRDKAAHLLYWYIIKLVYDFRKNKKTNVGSLRTEVQNNRIVLLLPFDIYFFFFDHEFMIYTDHAQIKRQGNYIYVLPAPMGICPPDWSSMQH